MELIRPAPPKPASAGSGSVAHARNEAAGRVAEGRAAEARPAHASATSAQGVPLRRSPLALDSSLQGDVASAQQALDYLAEVAGQLQSLKSSLSAKLANLQADERQIQAQLRQLASTLERRRQSGGGKLDAQLNFSRAAASQQFTMRGMNLDALQAGSVQSLSFTLGASGQALTVNLEPGLSRQEIAQRFEHALAPAKVRVGSNERGELEFSTPEANWPAVRDNLSILGRGRVATDEAPAAVMPEGWGGSDTEALRRSLQEVVRALAQVKRAQDAASRELSAAAGRAAIAPVQEADMQALAQDFAATAKTPDYESLLKITSAMVGISRERVMALLGLR